jgi:hypothetical protein
MVLVIPDDKAYEAGAMPDADKIAAMMNFNEELIKAGVWLEGEGLHPSKKGARIHFAGGKQTITDGPFTEAREILGGYFIWQCKSKEEAMAWASRCPADDGTTLEIRQVIGSEDFGPEAAAREAELIELNKRLEAERKRAG